MVREWFGRVIGRRFGAAVVLTIAGIFVSLAPAGSQTPAARAPQPSSTASKPPSATPATPSPSTPPLTTAWGAPSLEGIWISGDTTPVETPDPADQASLAALSKWFPGNDFTSEKTATTDPVVTYSGPKRRSLVTEPASGRLLIKQSAIDERDYNLNHLNDSYVNQTLWERCISRGAALFPAPYDSAYQILQTPDTIAIFYELLHVPRVIPISNSPHLTSNIKQWMGDSRAHWEGKTLVVDTTNYRDKTILGSATTSRRLRGLPHSESLHTVERFTRVDQGTIHYEVLIEDPKTYDSSWKAAFDLLAPPPSYQLLESACHEGNEYLPAALRGARVEEGTLKSDR
jgi:hypothetical protein